MGERDLDPGRRIFAGQGESLHLRTRDPEPALKELFARDRQHVFLEGGPTLAAAFLRAGLVDEIVTYVAPMLLGSGRNAVADLGIETICRRPPTRRHRHHRARRNRRRVAQRSDHHEARRGPLMFTGIVEELGTIESVEDQGDAIRLTVKAGTRARGRRARRLDLGQRLLPDRGRDAPRTPGPPT